MHDIIKVVFALCLALVFTTSVCAKPTFARESEQNGWTQDFLGIDSFQNGRYVTGTLVGAADATSLGLIGVSGAVMVNAAMNPGVDNGYTGLAIFTPIIWAGIIYLGARVVALAGAQYEEPKISGRRPEVSFAF